MPRRLTRSRSDRIVSGVAGGLGAYFGVDPTVVRALFVLLAATGGLGVVLYALLAIVVPDGPYDLQEPVRPASAGGPDGPSIQRQSPARRNAFALLVIALGTFLLFNSSLVWFRLDLLWPLVVIAAGLYLLVRR